MKEILIRSRQGPLIDFQIVLNQCRTENCSGQDLAISHHTPFIGKYPIFSHMCYKCKAWEMSFRSCWVGWMLVCVPLKPTSKMVCSFFFYRIYLLRFIFSQISQEEELHLDLTCPQNLVNIKHVSHRFALNCTAKGRSPTEAESISNRPKWQAECVEWGVERARVIIILYLMSLSVLLLRPGLLNCIWKPHWKPPWRWYSPQQWFTRTETSLIPSCVCITAGAQKEYQVKRILWKRTNITSYTKARKSTVKTDDK